MMRSQPQLDPRAEPLVKRLAEDLAAKQRIIIQGNSGAGKTTLMYWILQHARCSPSVYIDSNKESFHRGGVPGATVFERTDPILKRYPGLGKIIACSLQELSISERANPEFVRSDLETLLAKYWEAGAGGVVTILGANNVDASVAALKLCYPTLTRLATRYVHVRFDDESQTRRYIEDSSLLR